MEASIQESVEKGFVKRFLEKITTTNREQSQDTVALKINSFQSLPKGWDYGQGGPCEIYVVKKALEILSLAKLQGFSSEAQPTTEGGILMIFSKEDHFLDVLINSDTTLDVRIEKGSGSDFEVLLEEEDVSKADVLNFLIKTKRLYLECHLSALSTKENTVLQNTNFHQNTLDLMVGEFQYSMQGALC